MNPRMEVIFGAYIGIEDGKIVSIERKPPAEAPKAIVDGTGMVAIPGLINCHTHLATASLRCFTDDLGNTEALQALLQKEAKMDSRSAKAAASLAIAECLRFGVTSVSDLYYYPNATAEAVAESGIKANLALSSYRFIDENEDFDFETDEQCRELVKVTEKWNGFDGGRIKIDAGIYGGLRRRAEPGHAAAPGGDPKRGGLLPGTHRHEPRGAIKLPQCVQPSHHRRGLYIFNRGRA